jgi:heat-inducible transcriptional repressor
VLKQDSNLDDRKEQVLRAVVVDYTSTAIPVGSQALAQRHFARWSAATIRNELAYLMETGHLRQPHTSSGRVPSDLGYRYFVDYLMEEESVSRQLQHSILEFFEALPLELEAILEGTALAMARAADNVGVVTAPRTSEAKLKYTDLIHLDAGRILAIVVLEGNLVRQQPVELQADIDQELLSQFSNQLNHDLKGKTAADLRQHLEANRLEDWQAKVVEGVAEFMAAHDSQTATVVIHDGVRNLLKQPEFGDAGRLMPVLELLEESRALARVLESIAASEKVEVVIGDENGNLQLRECSLVMTTYGTPGFTGTLGTIGPTRMAYPQVVARLRYISELASQAVARLYQ